MCSEKIKVKNAAYYAANSLRLRAGKKKYYAENRERIKATAKLNKSRFNVYKRAYLARTPEARLAGNMRTRVYIALTGSTKSASTFEMVGCSISELRRHLEGLFKPGMTWENYGPVWHVDHIKPCVKFDLTDPEQQQVCFHYNNLQPLFAEENLRKERK